MKVIPLMETIWQKKAQEQIQNGGCAWRKNFGIEQISDAIKF